MKAKILTVIIIWLVVATAATSSVAVVYSNKKNKISSEMAANVNINKTGSENGDVENQKLKNAGKIDSPLRSKEEILTDLDQNMEKIIFDEE